MMSESWSTILGYERYAVSDQGRVKNNETNKILKPRISNHGTNKHAKVTLSVEGKAHQKFVHRLVAGAFIQPLKATDIVNHKNGLQTDNRLKNLEICDLSANARHSFALRSKISRSNAVFIPLENSSYKGLFISLAHTKQDDELFQFFESECFQCIKCKDRNEIALLIQNYLNM